MKNQIVTAHNLSKRLGNRQRGFTLVEIAIVLVIIGYSLTTLVVYLQKRLTPWKESERDQGV